MNECSTSSTKIQYCTQPTNRFCWTNQSFTSWAWLNYGRCLSIAISLSQWGTCGRRLWSVPKRPSPMSCFAKWVKNPIRRENWSWQMLANVWNKIIYLPWRRCWTTRLSFWSTVRESRIFCMNMESTFAISVLWRTRSTYSSTRRYWRPRW